MLLIDHDDRKLRHRTEHGESRTDHDARTPFMRRQPSGRAFGVREVAVQCHHVLAREACAQQRFELRRQIDFRHQQQRLRGRIRRESACDRAQVDLGLAAAGDAEQQVRREIPDAFISASIAATCCVVCSTCGMSDSAQRGCARARSRDERLRVARAGHAAQRTGQRRQRHFAPRVLVILGREASQLQPMCQISGATSSSARVIGLILCGSIAGCHSANDDADPSVSPERNNAPNSDLSIGREVRIKRVIERLQRRVGRR